MNHPTVNFTQTTSYQAIVKPGSLQELPTYLKQLGLGPQVIIITDEQVNNLYAQDTEKLLQDNGFDANIIELPSGEKYKVYNTIGKIYNILRMISIDRSSVVVAIGGGVVGDVAAFAAATWMRGVPLVQVPTTLLAQVDSCLGGKAAVNHLGLKNLIGTFYHPELILVDPAVLASLSADDYDDGLAEIVKTALLDSQEFFELVRVNASGLLRRETDLLAQVIERCLRFKASVVSKDPFDQGVRRVLNLGHTLGHAIEELAADQYSHGEAVSVGLHFMLRLSERIGLPSDVAQAAICLLDSFGLPIVAPGLNSERLLALLKMDKKASRGINRWIMLKDVGEPLITEQLPEGWQAILDELVEDHPRL